MSSPQLQQERKSSATAYQAKFWTVTRYFYDARQFYSTDLAVLRTSDFLKHRVGGQINLDLFDDSAHGQTANLIIGHFRFSDIV